MNQIFSDFNAEALWEKKKSKGDNDGKKKERVFKKPVQLDKSDVSRDGSFEIKFNQKMKVPDFIDNGESRKTLRQTGERTGDFKVKIPLSQLDVTRDICSVRFILSSDIEPESIKYFLEIKRWDESGLAIGVNFTNPLLISRGEGRDLMEITIKRP